MGGFPPEAALTTINAWFASLDPYITLVGFLIGLPTLMAAYYQTLKTRQEARRAREGTLHSRNCLEYVGSNGTCVNLVPLETLNFLPRVGDVVLLPGHGLDHEALLPPGAYRVDRIEHIYTRVVYKGSRPQEARLTKAVAQVTSLHDMFED
jgi:hypothetical protein